jgi:tetratricopeptide (TPR) repeat protein
LKWKKILVTALTKAGKFDDAEMLGKELCKETEQALGANHQNSLVCLQDLGAIYRSQGRLVEAISAFEKAFKGLTRILGSEHPFTKDALSAYSEVLEEVEEREVSDCI